MKPIRRCLRILILGLLSVSVFSPVVFFSYRIKQHSLIGRREFVEDLSNIKYWADAALKLSAIEQESGEDLKEPKQVVYADSHSGSVVSHSDSLNQYIRGSKKGGGTIEVLERNETTHDGIESHQLHQREISSTDEEEEHSDGKRAEHHDDQEQHHDDTSSWYHGITDGKIEEMKDVTRVQHDQNRHSQSQKVTNEMVMEMKDQVIRAKAYLSFTPPGSNSHLVKELKQRIREVERAVGQATKDSSLSRSSLQKMRYMEATLLRASHLYPECSAMVSKLRAMTHNTEEQVRSQKNQATYLVHLAARMTPKGLHCLSMRLTAEYFALQPEERLFSNQQKLQDTELYHYAVFSDNVLACAVVVNSTISSARDAEKFVFHVITDSLNLPAISVWFLLNPPGKATIQIQTIDNFEWLSTKYKTLMKQNSSDPRYSSELNHLRFYLPDIFPALDKIVLLDHDVVVKRDLTELWSIDMKGKVNGAVETCYEREAILNRMDLLLNFSDPIIAKMFDDNSCTWAFGMNLFDLNEWRQQNLTAFYHKFLQQGNERPLWKGGSLPLGWVTFYNQTMALDRRWHVLGLGYDSAIRRVDIEQAAVIHYDGVMKPWLDIAVGRYKGYWSQFVKYDHPFLQQCNFQE